MTETIAAMKPCSTKAEFGNIGTHTNHLAPLSRPMFQQRPAPAAALSRLSISELTIHRALTSQHSAIVFSPQQLFPLFSPYNS
ncbi:MAG: hypothetical protein U5M23_09190 [Marinagarivorans sp.]|nr:hypothetical protein [Marinagarivorans sp.]